MGGIGDLRFRLGLSSGSSAPVVATAFLVYHQLKLGHVKVQHLRYFRGHKKAAAHGRIGAMAQEEYKRLKTLVGDKGLAVTRACADDVGAALARIAPPHL